MRFYGPLAAKTSTSRQYYRWFAEAQNPGANSSLRGR
jgi:hypothetical protein